MATKAEEHQFNLGRKDENERIRKGCLRVLMEMSEPGNPDGIRWCHQILDVIDADRK